MTSRHPFTAAQWQELEHQTLFFKFMVAGLPIPSDLIFRIKGRSSQQPHHIVGWTCFQLGSSQISTRIDPEPSRCRRTDGKKWRCSRHTTGDSKYCERHMHRGKSRPSRKHPEPKPLETFPSSSLLQESAASTVSGTQSSSNISSVTCDMNHHQHQHHLNLFNTHLFIPVKDSTFKTFVNIEESSAGVENRILQYHQFIEESPETRRDSLLKLVI